MRRTEDWGVFWCAQTMKQQSHEISSGVYTYRHRCDGGVDVHDVLVKDSTFRVLLLYIGVVFLLADVFLSKESLFLGSFWSILLTAIFAKCLRYKPVTKVSLVFMPALGVQLEEHFRRRVHRQFLPIDKILKPFLNQALLLRDEDEDMLVFKKFHPPVKMLVPIWRALCAFTDSNSTSPSSSSTR